MSLRLGQKGFSLTEITIALGIMGGIALISAKLLQTQQGNDTYIKGRSEISNAISAIKTSLNDPTNCRSMLGGNVVSATPANVTMLRIPLKGSPGQFMELMKPNTFYPGFKTEAITIVQPAGMPTNMANLIIEFRMKSRDLKKWGSAADEYNSSRIMSETLPIMVTKDASNKLTDCGPVLSEMNEMAKEKFCRSLGTAAVWDSLGTKTCIYRNLVCPPGQVKGSMDSLGDPTCIPLQNQIDLNNLFDGSSTCLSGGNFRIIDNGAGKLKIDCF